MSFRKAALPALALAVGLSGAAGLGTLTASRAFAQASAAPASGDQQMKHHERHERRGEFGRHLDGRIAFLKAELKITDAQAPQWEKVAAAMRDNARDMQQAAAQFRANRDQPQNAMQRLEARANFAALHATTTKRLADAFGPLYSSLSDSQKQSADELLAHHGHGHGEGRDFRR
jgi:hypothetical protein